MDLQIPIDSPEVYNWTWGGEFIFPKEDADAYIVIVKV